MPFIDLFNYFMRLFSIKIIKWRSITYYRCLLAVEKPTSKIDSASKFYRTYMYFDGNGTAVLDMTMRKPSAHTSESKEEAVGGGS